jgi:5-methylcytosine-specific restriction endonuclease McrA
MSKVNLDALIPREDFMDNSDVEEVSFKKNDFSISDIESFTASYLRKPDFQRETNEWDKEKIADFIDSFLSGDLIPAIILWKAKNGLLFVIDGSHRLSALIAWVKNDFGDGDLSKRLYDSKIPEEQINIAENTRKFIRKRIGSYSDYKLALTNPEKVDDQILRRVKNLASIGIQLQWVSGDDKKAEHSFININQKSSPIDPTELKLIKGREKANCISARAIIKSGTGHKYWSNFNADTQQTIQTSAKDIYEILFLPKLKTPIKTLDTPIGGQTFKSQTLPLVFEFVNIANNCFDKSTLSNDETGEETIKYLKNTLKVARRINSQHPSSLGLHPTVYFYSQKGRHKPASFYAITALMKILDEKNGWRDFIEVRMKFEKFILDNDDLVSQITRKKRSGTEAYSDIRDFFLKVINLLKTNEDNILSEVIKIKKFNYLKINDQNQDLLTTTDRKSAVFLREAFNGCIKCSICNGYLHTNSISMDHIVRKREGGMNDSSNLQMTHPYCNSTIKN